MQTPIQHRGPLAGQLAGWQARLAGERQRHARFLPTAPTADYAHHLFDLELTLARVAVAVGDKDELAQIIPQAAAAGAAAALAEWFAEGQIEVRRGADVPLRVPVGANHLVLPEWCSALACACLARDPQALRILTRPALLNLIVDKTRLRAAPVGGEAFWLPFGQLLAAVVQRAAVPAALLVACRERLRDADPGLLDPENLRAEKEPLVALLAALATGELRHWKALVRDALARFDAYYAQPEWAQLDIGMFPLLLAAVCALAHDRYGTAGGAFAIESPYLPPWLVRGEFARSPISLVYSFPRRTARDAAEIHWSFDLDGIPRSGRQHRLREENGVLLASYEIHDWDEVPEARAEFVLATAEAPLLLDAGALLLVADLHAQQVPAHPQGPPEILRAQRFHLHEAQQALEALLALLPAGAAHVPETAFRTARGRAVRAAEPGRFALPRLQAVLAAYQKIQAELDTQLHQAPLPATKAEEAACANALLAIALLKTQVTPLLQELAGPQRRAVVQALKPHDNDYAKVFVGAAINLARQGYEASWDATCDIAAPAPTQTELRIGIAAAGMLADENELSRDFPGGYRLIAPWLNPYRVWVCWKYVRPAERAGLAFNGLVWVDDHWAWFPKPYRILSILQR